MKRPAPNRLLEESFIVLEPSWTVRTGSVPFWMKFNVQSSADALETYLDGRAEFDEIRSMLFSHGTESAGLAPIARWRELLGRARRTGDFVGVDEERYPRDFASFGRYQTEVQRILSRYPMPGYLTLDQLERFLASPATVTTFSGPSTPP